MTDVGVGVLAKRRVVPEEYSCTASHEFTCFRAVVASHCCVECCAVQLVGSFLLKQTNKRILTASIQVDDTAAAATINNKTCNRRQKKACPLDGNCLQPSVIYQATVTRKDNNTTETYIGLTENDFKTRYRNHTASFRHAKHRNSTELSKHIWTLKDNNIEHFISWRILSSHSPYNSSSKRCNLCLKEKILIICRPELLTLNKRNELVSSCRHRNKALLRNN